MKGLYRILMGEVLKLRRTLAVRLAICAPIIVVLIIFGGYALGRNIGGGARVLIGYGQLVLTIWTLVVFPLFAALVAALLASIEHQNETWRHLFALPVRRSTVFAAKWIVGLGLLVFSLIVLAGGVVTTAEILRLMKAGWASASLPAIVVLRGAVVSSCAVVLLFSIQMWVSLRWRSFTPGLVVAIIALAVILVAVPRGFAWLGSLFPWSLPAMAMAPHNPYYRMAVWWGLLAGMALGAVACWRLSTREFC